MNCPYSFLGLGKCSNKCAKYVEMTENYQEGREIKSRQVGKCSDVWSSILQAELNQTVRILSDNLANVSSKKVK